MLIISTFYGIIIQMYWRDGNRQRAVLIAGGNTGISVERHEAEFVTLASRASENIIPEIAKQPY